MPRYVDADSAKEIYLSKSAGEQLDRVPTADVQEVKHGKWEYNENGCISCSECKTSFAFRDEIWFKSDNKYCRNCGAKMDGDSTTNNIYNCETCKNLCCDGCEMYEGAKNGG